MFTISRLEPKKYEIISPTKENDVLIATTGARGVHCHSYRNTCFKDSIFGGKETNAAVFLCNGLHFITNKRHFMQTGRLNVLLIL
jgi:hypothetical protein